MAQLKTGTTIGGRDVMLEIDNLDEEVIAHKAETLTQVFNAKTGFGAAGDGTTDDTAAIMDAISAAKEAGGGIVYLPSGTYLISRILDDQENPRSACIIVASNVHLVGDGMDRTVILLAPDAPSWTRMISFESGFSNCAVKDMTLDGQKDTVSSGNEHMAGIFVANGSDLLVRNVRVKDTYGDNIQLYGGMNAPYLSNVYIENCILEDSGRNNLTCEQAKNVWVRGCQLYRAGANAFDSEPFSEPIPDSPDGLWGPYYFTQNRIADATRDGYQSTGDAFHFMTDNHISDCGGHNLFIRNGRGTIRNNYIYGGGDSPLELIGACEGMTVEKNTIILTDPTVLYGIYIVSSAGQPRDISVLDNIIVGAGPNTEGTGTAAIQLQGSMNQSVRGNRVTGCQVGISINVTDTNPEGMGVTQIADNVITGAQTAVYYTTSVTPRAILLTIKDNFFIGSTWNGVPITRTILFNSTIDNVFPIIANNYYQNTATLISTTGAGTNLAGWIEKFDQSGRHDYIYRLNDTPEGNLTAVAGSWCTTLTNNKRWYKASGSGNTGWINAVDVIVTPDGTKRYAVYIDDSGNLTTTLVS